MDQEAKRPGCECVDGSHSICAACADAVFAGEEARIRPTMTRAAHGGTSIAEAKRSIGEVFRGTVTLAELFDYAGRALAVAWFIQGGAHVCAGTSAGDPEDAIAALVDALAVRGVRYWRSRAVDIEIHMDQPTHIPPEGIAYMGMDAEDRSVRKAAAAVDMLRRVGRWGPSDRPCLLRGDAGPLPPSPRAAGDDTP